MGKDLRTRATAPARNDDEPTLFQLIERQKSEIGRALPRHMNPDRMARIATTVLRQTPALMRCTPESFLGALMTASQLGLEPGPLGEAYLVPYGRDCTFIPGYRGLIKLAYQSGEVSTIDAQIVREGDDFDYGLGLDPFLTHKPVLADEIGKPIAVYAVCIRKDGAKSFRVMSVAEVERIRRRSKASTNGPWKTDWESMAKKTVIKQLAKFMPLASENFNAANVLDGSTRTDVGELVDVAPSYDVDGTVEDDMPAVETQGSAELLPGDESEDESPTMDRDSLEVALDAAFTEQAIAAGQERLDWLANLVGDQVDNISDLSDTEIDNAIAVLAGTAK